VTLGTQSGIFGAGESAYIPVALNRYVEVRASKPVLIAQFGKSELSSAADTDPAMLVVPRKLSICFVMSSKSVCVEICSAELYLKERNYR
jgi:hypothetical protein